MTIDNPPKNQSNCVPYDGEIVISGMSGRFPEADSVAEFEEKLFAGVDMVTDDGRRWPSGLFGTPSRFGKVKNLDKFDANFFNVVSKNVKYVDPMQRILVELTHEAIIDSGVNPESLRGSRTGVFVGTMGSDASELTHTDPEKVNGYEAVGVMVFTLANRLSFIFDLRGPSFTLDTACSSSLFALNAAVRAIRSGECDGALVGGCNLCLTPLKSLRLYRLNMLSPVGKCQSFDAAGDGYARSEACVVIHIQRKDVALRSYASIVHIKTNSDGFKKEGVSFPSGQRQQQLMEEVYEEAGVDPTQVTYMEAHGTGTPAGDPQEVNAIARVFCKNPTQQPLLIGSVKSNIGHTEGASGLCSIVKVILAMRRSLLPANLHFNTPNPKIPSLLDGTIRVVNENTPWGGGLVGLNSFGVFGANCHVILRSPHKNNTAVAIATPQQPLPLIVALSGRTKEGVEFALEKIYQDDDTQDDVDNDENGHQRASSQREAVGLWHKIGETNTPNHSYRGYRVIQEFCEDTIEIQDQSKLTSFQQKLQRPPLWLVFTGMGSQWSGMGRELMVFKKFRESIMESAQTLKSKDPTFDLVDLIENGSEKKFQNVQNCFVAIAAVQVAMVEILRSLNLTFDGYLGHSVGELATAFCDGAFNAAQTVLAAHARGRAILESNFENGAMAAVGLSWEQAKVRCPKTIFPACHNSADGVTVAGPSSDVAAFIAELEKDHIFAKMVDSCGQAFHSPYIQEAGPKLRKYLQEILPGNVERSSKWISSSIPEADWTTSNLARWSGIDYHVNNLLSPVLFHEALAHVPPGAVVVEVAPHGLLQAVLRRSLDASCHVLPLNHRNGGSVMGGGQNVGYFLKAIGKLYNLGLNPCLANLYDPLQFPVSGQAGILSPLVQWDHSQSWEVHQFDQKNSIPSGDTVVKISLENPHQSFYAGHKLDDRIILPATGYLVMVWKGFAQLLGHDQKSFEDLPIIFENVTFHRATILPLRGEIELVLNFLQGTGEFQLREGSAVIVSGVIRLQATTESNFTTSTNNIEFFKNMSNSGFEREQNLKLSKPEIYTELGLRGYSYSQLFAGIKSYDHVTKWAELDWCDNWVSFLDTMLQIHLVERPNRFLHMPTRIEKLCIDPQIFYGQFKHSVVDKKNEDGGKNEIETVPAFYNKHNEVVSCPGIEIRGLKATTTPRRQGQQDPVLEEYAFVPYFDPDDPPLNDDEKNPKENLLPPLKFELGLRFCVDLVLENTIAPRFKYKIVEMMIATTATDSGDNFFQKSLQVAPTIEKIILNQPMLDCTIDVFSPQNESTGDDDQNGENSIRNENDRIVYHKMDDFSDQHFDDLTLPECHLIILHDPNLLKMAATAPSLQSQGFILLFSSFDASYSKSVAMETLHLVLVARKKIEEQGCLFLFRKMAEEPKIVENVEGENNQPITINIDHKDNNYDWVDDLKMAMRETAVSTAAMETENGVGAPKKIFLISTGQPHSGLIGLTNCLRHEPGGQSIRTIFVQSENPGDEEFVSKLTNFMTFDPKLKTVMEADLVMNVFVGKTKTWGSYRLLPLVTTATTSNHSIVGSVTTAVETDSTNTNLVTMASRKDKDEDKDHFYLTTLVKGDLSSLRWVRGQLSHGLENDPDNPICLVYFAALNFRDVMIASGKIPPQSIAGFDSDEKIYGVDYAGIRLSNGERIMGCVQGCGFSTLVEPCSDLTWPVPQNWTLEQASTIPTVYGTAYYALCLRGKIQEGETILIHSAAGGVGIAAIVVALSFKCTVYATVGSREKREFLKKLFPQLSDSNFASNRDTSFEDHVKMATKGRGVDIVLNSLAGEKFHASIRCLAEFGRFLEIGKVDLVKNTGIGSAIFLKGVTFHGILFDLLFINHNEKKRLAKLVANALESGIIKPLPTTVFNHSETEQAFRHMSTGKHMGKIVIKIRDEENNLNDRANPDTAIDAAAIAIATDATAQSKNDATSLSKWTHVVSRTYFDPSKCYIIIGGLGGFGLQLAAWCVERGAKKLVLVSRSGVTTGYQKYCIKNWRDHGGVEEIRTPRLNVANEKEAFQLLTECVQNLGEIGGIFNLGMVLSIDLMEKQTADRFRSVSEPKVNGTKWLDRAARVLAPNLDYFVTFSSVNSCRGSAGQANYGYANSVMERICEQRQQDGLPGLAIQWGAIGDVGVVARDFGGNDAIILGTIPQRIHSCLQVLDNFLQKRDKPVLASYVVFKKSTHKEAGLNGQGGGKTLNLVEGVAHILGIKNPATIDQNKSLEEMGLDSIMLAEVKYFAERETDLVLSHGEIGAMTFAKLKKLDDERRRESQNNGQGSLTTNSNDEGQSSKKMGLSEDDGEAKIEKSTPANAIPSKNSSAAILDHSDYSNGGENGSNSNEGRKDTVTSQKFVESGPLRPSVVTAENIFNEITPGNDDDPLENFDRFFDGAEKNLKFALNYFKELLLLILLFSTVLVILVPRQVVKMWYKIWYGNKVKLMDRPIDSIFTIEPSAANIVIRVKCAGRPNKDKMMTLCQQRVLDFSTNLRLDDSGGKNEKEPIKTYNPYGQSLRYKINHGSLFPTWVYHENLDLEQHFLFDLLQEANVDLEAEAKKVMENYLTHPLADDRPQWEIRILSLAGKKNEQEFYMIMAIHHSYGDAVTLANLLEHALADESESNSSLTPRDKKYGQKEQEQQEPSSNGMEGKFNQLKNFVISSMKSMSNFCINLHHWIGYMAQLTFEDAKTCPLAPPVTKKRTIKRCQWVTMEAGKFRKLRSSKTGKLIPFTPIVFSCISKAYGKIFEEEKNLKKYSNNPPPPTDPKNVIVMSPLTMRPYERLGLVNNFSMGYFCFPISGGGKNQQQNSQIMEQDLVKLQQISDRGGQRQLLDMTWLVLAALSKLPESILRLAHCSPKYSLIVSTMPLLVSKNLSIGGHKVLEMIGYPPILHGAQGSLACTVHTGTITFSMAVEEEEGDSGEGANLVKGRLDNFLHYFEQELDNLVSVCGVHGGGVGGGEEKWLTKKSG